MNWEVYAFYFFTGFFTPGDPWYPGRPDLCYTIQGMLAIGCPLKYVFENLLSTWCVAVLPYLVWFTAFRVFTSLPVQCSTERSDGWTRNKWWTMMDSLSRVFLTHSTNKRKTPWCRVCGCSARTKTKPRTVIREIATNHVIRHAFRHARRKTVGSRWRQTAYCTLSPTNKGSAVT